MLIESDVLWEKLAELCTDIASANSDFFCTECLATLDKLVEIAAELCGDEDSKILRDIIDECLKDDEEA